MTRTRGRARRGERLVAPVRHGHWNTTTFLAGLHHDRIVAPLVLDGSVNGAAFRAWVEQFLGPTFAPGDIAIADNLASHKVSGVREAIEFRGASMMFLPGYGPDLKPIEQVSAKLNNWSEARNREPDGGCGKPSDLASDSSYQTNVTTICETPATDSQPETALNKGVRAMLRLDPTC